MPTVTFVESQRSSVLEQGPEAAGLLVGVGEDVRLIHARQRAVVHDDLSLADDRFHVPRVEGVAEVAGEIGGVERRGRIIIEDDQIVEAVAGRAVIRDVPVDGAQASGDMPPSASPAMK